MAKNNKWYWLKDSDDLKRGWWCFDNDIFDITILSVYSDSYNKKYEGPFRFQVSSYGNEIKVYKNDVQPTLKGAKYWALDSVWCYLDNAIGNIGKAKGKMLQPKES